MTNISTKPWFPDINYEIWQPATESNFSNERPLNTQAIQPLNDIARYPADRIITANNKPSKNSQLASLLERADLVEQEGPITRLFKQAGLFEQDELDEPIQQLTTQPQMNLADQAQISVNSRYAEAVANDQLDIAKDLRQGTPLPNQEGVNKAFFSAFYRGNLETLRFTMTRPHPYIPLPSRQLVISLYNEARMQGRNDIADQLHLFIQHTLPSNNAHANKASHRHLLPKPVPTGFRYHADFSPAYKCW